MVLCWQYRFLIREQIQRLLDFNCTTRVNIRLRKLYDGKYLDRRFLPFAAGTSQAIYSLGGKGVEIVANSLGIEPNEVHRQRRRNAKARELFLMHHLEVNNVRIAFELCSGVKIARWAYELQIPLDGNGKLRPDAFFQVVYKERLYSFFLELDRGTESINRFVGTKIPAYLKTIQSNAHKRLFGINYFGVLTVTQNRKRLTSLFSAISKKFKGVFWFIEKDRLTPDSITEPIFAKAGHESRLSIFGGAG